MKQITGTSCFITQEGKVLAKDFSERTPKVTPQGYHEMSFYLKEDKIRKWFRIHRIVAEYYIPNPENKPFVNHKDGNKANNSVENLEWVTHRENMDHAINFGLVKRAEENANSKLTTDQAEQICKMLEHGYRNVDIAKSMQIPKSLVSSIRYGICWKHISCKYNIPERSRSLSVETAHWICKKIEEGLTQGQILKLTENKLITKTLIKDFRRKRIYKDISSQYNF